MNTSIVPAVARQYAHVLDDKPAEYTDYRNFKPSMGRAEDYSIAEKIGHGSFSDVFSGLHISSNKTVVLKLLKQKKTRIILKEVKVPQVLSGRVNIVEFLDIIYPKDREVMALVFEMAGSPNFFETYVLLNQEAVRLCIREILKGLNYCHSMGVMHRDIKPDNIVFNLQQKVVKIIDWGLAEFYHPEQKYSVRSGTLFYKAPELLLRNPYVTYSADIWSLGCLFAAMIFRSFPFFPGANSADQLVQIVQTLGSDDLRTYMQKYSIDVDTTVWRDLETHPRKQWDTLKNSDNTDYVSSNACDLISSMLCYDHIKRITAEEALQHPYFSHPTNTEQKCNFVSCGKTFANWSLLEAHVIAHKTLPLRPKAKPSDLISLGVKYREVLPKVRVEAVPLLLSDGDVQRCIIERYEKHKYKTTR